MSIFWDSTPSINSLTARNVTTSFGRGCVLAFTFHCHRATEIPKPFYLRCQFPKQNPTGPNRAFYFWVVVHELSGDKNGFKKPTGNYVRNC